MQWLLRLSVSFFQLVEEAKYGTSFGGCMRQCLKLSKSLEDARRYGALGHSSLGIYDAADKERADYAPEAASPPSAAQQDRGRVWR